MDVGQQTRAVLTTPTGEPVDLPASILTAEDATLLGEYESWLSRARLIRALSCRDCGPQQAVQVFVEPTRIGLICGHRMWYYEGPVPLVLTEPPEARSEE